MKIPSDKDILKEWLGALGNLKKETEQYLYTNDDRRFKFSREGDKELLGVSKKQYGVFRAIS